VPAIKPAALRPRLQTRSIEEDADLARRLFEARNEIERMELMGTDSRAALESLGQLAGALESEDLDPARVRSLWNDLQNLAPTAAGAVRMAAVLARVLR